MRGQHVVHYLRQNGQLILQKHELRSRKSGNVQVFVHTHEQLLGFCALCSCSRRTKGWYALTVAFAGVLMFSRRTRGWYALTAAITGVLTENSRTSNSWALTITCVHVLIFSSSTSGRYRRTLYFRMNFIFAYIRGQAGTSKIKYAKISCLRIIDMRENSIVVFGLVCLSLAS